MGLTDAECVLTWLTKEQSRQKREREGRVQLRQGGLGVGGTWCVTVMQEKSVRLPAVSLWQFTEIGAEESEPAHLTIMAGEENTAYHPISESVIQE